MTSAKLRDFKKAAKSATLFIKFKIEYLWNLLKPKYHTTQISTVYM